MRIAVLEDDKDLADLLQEWLKEAGHDGHFFSTGREFIKQLPYIDPHLAILDWNVPGLSGFEVMRWMKASEFSETPIIFATTRASLDDLVQALGDGADDYIIKPIRQGELLARITAVSRPYKIEDDDQDSHPYEFDAYNQTVSYDQWKTSSKLTLKEFQLAKSLFTYPNRIFSRDMLLESVWGQNASVSSRTIDTHVSRVRIQLKLDGTFGWQLISVYGKGYKLTKE